MELNRLALGGKLAVTLLLINILLGLVLAHIEVRYALGGKDGEPGITMTDIRLYFQGDPTHCQLETMMHGRMGKYFGSPDEREAMDDWIADGAPREAYDSTVAPILEARCVKCHGPGGEKVSSPLTTYEEVCRFVESSDTGVSYESLAAASYSQLVLMTLLAALAAGLFYLTRFTGRWKEVLMIVPFAAVFLNVLSWWSVKQSAPFLHIIVASSLFLAISIIVMVLLTLVDIWILSGGGEERER